MTKKQRCPNCGSSVHQCSTGTQGCLHCDTCSWSSTDTQYQVQFRFDKLIAEAFEIAGGLEKNLDALGGLNKTEQDVELMRGILKALKRARASMTNLESSEQFYAKSKTS